ncbi:MAG TPA: hypothetical protein VK791_05610 [bacterium]|jgi:hypothetical protein|nr:hypothetical protein [bacterium]
MRLVETNELGEALYECDRCQIAGPKDSCIIEDNNQHLCMSCWYEKQRSRAPKERRSVVVEI